MNEQDLQVHNFKMMVPMLQPIYYIVILLRGMVSKIQTKALFDPTKEAIVIYHKMILIEAPEPKFILNHRKGNAGFMVKP